MDEIGGGIRMNNIRKNGIVGVLEWEDYTDDKIKYLHFSEWWNGEGVDFTFNHGTLKEKRIDLDISEMENLAVAMIVSGYIDIDECRKKAKKVKSESKARTDSMKEFALKYNPDGNPF